MSNNPNEVLVGNVLSKFFPLTDPMYLYDVGRDLALKGLITPTPPSSLKRADYSSDLRDYTSRATLTSTKMKVLDAQVKVLAAAEKAIHAGATPTNWSYNEFTPLAEAVINLRAASARNIDAIIADIDRNTPTPGVMYAAVTMGQWKELRASLALGRAA